MTGQVYDACIKACLSCVTACQHCATECLKENDIKMLSLCIAINRECAIICSANAQLLAIGGENTMMLCGECATICEECAKECKRNSEFEHCAQCAKECKKCAEECHNLMEVQLT
jgi:hypothetical protein